MACGISQEPGRVPMRVGVSIGDTRASLHGVIGVLLGLNHRNNTKRVAAPKGAGQVIDVALYESVFNVMESLLPEYSAFAAVREPAGSALPGIAQSNAYTCRDGQVLVAGNGASREGGFVFWVPLRWRGEGTDAGAPASGKKAQAAASTKSNVTASPSRSPSFNAVGVTVNLSRSFEKPEFQPRSLLSPAKYICVTSSLRPLATTRK